MTIWDLRQSIESSIPVWAPFALVGALVVAYILDKVFYP
jgi:hypothetical protein